MELTLTHTGASDRGTINKNYVYTTCLGCESIQHTYIPNIRHLQL